MAQKSIKLAFSTHRAETLPFAADNMHDCDAIILEEPVRPRFREMLDGKCSIEEYLLEADFEFPDFAGQLCTLLKDLHARDKALYQVDPFLDILEEIHDFFGSGGTPQEAERHARFGEVYKAERRWTSALLQYYDCVSKDSFEEIVSSIQGFARADAARGRLRDPLRAEAIARVVVPYEVVYVEAGEIHASLVPELRKKLDREWRIQPLFLMEPVVRPLTGRKRILGPGDLLTLLYMTRPQYEGDRMDLLAARSLVHVKILKKEEIEPSAFEHCPHTRDEVETCALVEQLTYEDCRMLFLEIRGLPTETARNRVRNYCERPVGRSP